MLETDAPFLTPRTMPRPPADRRNEPAFLTFIRDTVAAALGRPASEVAAATTATARSFFGLPDPAQA
jgi:TatD DNase family protein